MASRAASAGAAILSLGASCAAGFLLWQKLWRRKPKPWPDHDLEVPFSELHRLHEVIDREGVAIVTGVIDAGELREMEQDFVRDLSDIIDEDALRACDDARVHAAHKRFVRDGLPAFPYATIARLQRIPGFVMQGCVSAASFAWRVRRHPRVHAAFGALFPGAGELVSSMDVTFFTPEGGPPEDECALCAHVDQNGNDTRAPNLGGCNIFQGVLYVWPAKAGETTTVVWPRSHKTVWPRMMADPAFVASGAKGNHYSELREIGDAPLRRELLAGWQQHHRRLQIPAGSLLIWNSRTVHTGFKRGPRFAQMVCLEPARERPPEQRLAKLRLAALVIPSTHWARIGHQHDVLPHYEGCLSEEPPCHARGADTHGDVLLPLRPAVRPAPLSDGADLAALRPLARVDWDKSSHFCVWDPPPESAALLEASVREDFKRFI